MKYLLDADTISFYTRENHNVIQALQKHQAKNCCVSSVTRMEIEFGLQLVSDRRNKLDAPQLSIHSRMRVLRRLPKHNFNALARRLVFTTSCWQAQPWLEI
jgi:predicted nucleic acid-binding protein